MHSELTELFRQERERVFTPAPGFCGGVMFRLQEEPAPPQTLWEIALATSKPMLAATLTCLLVLIGIHMTMPVAPSRGLAEISAELEIPAAQQALYVDVETPPTAVVVEQLILEDGE